MPLVTFFSVLELPEKNRKGGCNNPPLVRRGLNANSIYFFLLIKEWTWHPTASHNACHQNIGACWVGTYLAWRLNEIWYMQLLFSWCKQNLAFDFFFRYVIVSILSPIFTQNTNCVKDILYTTGGCVFWQTFKKYKNHFHQYSSILPLLSLSCLKSGSAPLISCFASFNGNGSERRWNSWDTISLTETLEDTSHSKLLGNCWSTLIDYTIFNWHITLFCLCIDTIPMW